MVLIDSSIYIHLLRGGFDPVVLLAERYDPAAMATCDIVRVEVLRGIVQPKAHEKFAMFFDLLVHVPMDRRAWRQTEELAWELDRRGHTLPLPDLIIAICAIRANAEVLTRDEDFRLVPKLQLAEW